MNGDLQKASETTILPPIRVAPLGELNAYVISEAELNELEHGSPASLYLNIALALIGSGVSFFVTLLFTDIPSVHKFIVFVIVTVLFLLVGIILFVGWLPRYRSSKSIAQRIRDRMPPAPGIAET